MAYHAGAGVHAGVRFTIVSQDERHCRYRQEVTLLGIYRFAGNATLTSVWVTFEIPARGVKRWIAPPFRWVAQRALRKAFEEDRRDLESDAYARYRARAADAA